MRKKRGSYRQQGPFRGSLSPLSCFEPARIVRLIKPAYNQSQLDGWLRLTASTFSRLWISIAADLFAVPTVSQNLLHPLSTSIVARHLLDFMVQGKITAAGALTIHMDATPSTLTVPLPDDERKKTQCDNVIAKSDKIYGNSLLTLALFQAIYGEQLLVEVSHSLLHCQALFMLSVFKC